MHLCRNAFANGNSNAPILGDPADHVEATPAEIHQYHKVLNYPTKIYPQGVFFLLNTKKAIIASSTNTEDFFGSAGSALIGKSFSSLFEQAGKVEAALAADDFYAINPLVVKSKGGAATVNLILQSGPNGIMVDVEPIAGESEIGSKIAAVKAAAGKFETCSSEQELCDQVRVS